jgi:hypothetical protein
MKIFIIITLILVGIFIVFQIYVTMSTSRTEAQAYKVIRVEDDFEIRYYPAATMAMITSQSKSFSELGSNGFGTLAKYIFGGNSEKKSIAMTAPVHMDIGDSVSSMAFVMPSGYTKDNLPMPNNADVMIKTVSAEYVAVITFGGFASQESIDTHTALLQKALQAKGLTHSGNFRFLGYNPPFQFFGRRNEVIVAVDEDEVKNTTKK